MSNFTNRVNKLQEVISGFHKEDNINKLTKQTLFDHLNNVAMSTNNNTRSARVNAVSNTIENQLSKQHNTKLFKNLQEVEAEELYIDSVAEVEEMLKNYRNMKSKKVPAPLHTSVTENLDGNDIEDDDGDDSEKDDDCDNDGDDSEEDDDCDDGDELDNDFPENHCYDNDDDLNYDMKNSIAQFGKANNSSNDGNNNRINSNVQLHKKEQFQSSEAKSNDDVVLCNQMAFIRNQMRSPCLDECCKGEAKIPTTKKKRNDETLKSYVYEQTIMELEVRDISI